MSQHRMEYPCYTLPYIDQEFEKKIDMENSNKFCVSSTTGMWQ